jgi:putative hydrolase of the HAD superfamily
MVSMMQPRAVVFDYGHTLIDFAIPHDALFDIYGTIRPRLVANAEAVIPEISELVERVAGYVTRAVDDSYQRDRLVELDVLELFSEALMYLGVRTTPELARWVAETEHRAASAGFVCAPETQSTLQAIHDANIKVGIVSNAHLLPELMRDDWFRLGFGGLIDSSVISSEVGIRKPHPDIFDAILHKLQVSPTEVVFVGDRVLDDIDGAQKVGMTTILTTEFHHSTGRAQSQAELDAFSRVRPDLTVTALPQILPFLSVASPGERLNKT